jgi:hypothetical protein
MLKQILLTCWRLLLLLLLLAAAAGVCCGVAWRCGAQPGGWCHC